ncbi:putative serpin-Z5 [Phragmites australis]|uniref:putative serpin-Z5 n=1 Tax=Phragmites australis TaxID=29695 RepID=UPI002D7A0EA1|nr:putative serpin-Z5 [Phragmites australis]
MATADVAAAAAARDGQTALALRLAKHLAPNDDNDTAGAGSGGNVAFSPVSVHAALALVAAGARGATLEQLLAFLGAPSAKVLADFGRRVSDRVLADRSDSGGPRVLFGGGVWVDASRGGLAEAFCDIATESYKSEARTVSFTEEPAEAVDMINEWVKKATDNLIDSVISASDVDADTDLVLANAVYFKGEWLVPFQPYCTSPGTFHLLDGGHAEAEFMPRFALMQVACMDGFKVLKLPYMPGRKEAPGAGLPLKRRRGQGGDEEAKASPWPNAAEVTRYSMFVFLPDARDGIAAMVDVVTVAPAFLYGILAEMKQKYVNLKLPKFQITFNWGKLDDALSRLGLSLPFSPVAADLRGMCKGDDSDGGSRQPMFLSKVAHRAVVKVNESGTEAAAVTFCMRGGGYPSDTVEFIADHPFTFFIMEERSGVIVFAGHVLDPTK